MKNIKFKAKLKRKSGFTLVECLVSIAVFAIMALIVTTIISASLRTHTDNKRTSRGLLTQKEALASRTVDVGTGLIDEGDTDGGLRTDDVKITINGTSATFRVKCVITDEGAFVSEQHQNKLEITNIKILGEENLNDSELRNPPPPPPPGP